MKLTPFSKDVCDDLISKGFRYLVLKENYINDEFNVSVDTVTFEALRSTRSVVSIPIEEMMGLPQNAHQKYYVLVKD